MSTSEQARVHCMVNMNSNNTRGRIMYINGTKLMRSDGKEYDYEAICLSHTAWSNARLYTQARGESYAVLCRSRDDSSSIVVFRDRTRLVVDTTTYIRPEDVQNVSYISSWYDGSMASIFSLLVSYTNGLILYLSFRVNFLMEDVFSREEAFESPADVLRLMRDDYVGTHGAVSARYITLFIDKDVKYMTGDADHLIKSDYIFRLNLRTNIITRDDSITIPPESLRMIDIVSYRIINQMSGLAGFLVLSRDGKLFIKMIEELKNDPLRKISFDDVLDYSELMCESDGKFSIIILDRNYTLSRHDINIKSNKVNIDKVILSENARNIRFSFCYLNTYVPAKNARKENN